MKKLVISQFVLLLGGLIFAWTNFAIELIDWLNKRTCTTGCSVGLNNPFLSSCFYGAIGFLAAFILSVLILRKLLKANKESQKPV